MTKRRLPKWVDDVLDCLSDASNVSGANKFPFSAIFLLVYQRFFWLSIFFRAVFSNENRLYGERWCSSNIMPMMTVILFGTTQQLPMEKYTDNFNDVVLDGLFWLCGNFESDSIGRLN